jgi:hypothetical protein
MTSHAHHTVAKRPRGLPYNDSPRPEVFTRSTHRTVVVYGSPRVIQITYSNDIDTVDKWCAAACSTGVMGLDCEHPPVFRPGQSSETTVLQLAYDDKVLVIQLNALTPPAGSARGARGGHNVVHSPSFVMLFSRAGSAFAGMGVAQDVAAIATVLKIDLSIPAAIDLKSMAVARGHDMPGGLGALAIALLGVEKWKSKKLALSRWGQWPLQQREVEYAAMDAWASWAVYSHMEAEAPVPLTAAIAEPSTAGC